MLQRWSRAYTHLSRLGSQKNFNFRNDFYAISWQSYKKASAAVAPATADTVERSSPGERPVGFTASYSVFLWIHWHSICVSVKFLRRQALHLRIICCHLNFMVRLVHAFDLVILIHWRELCGWRNFWIQIFREVKNPIADSRVMGSSIGTKRNLISFRV